MSAYRKDAAHRMNHMEREVTQMKASEFIGKIKGLCRRAGTKTLIACCAVLVLGGVIVLNFILQKEPETDNSNKLAVDLSSQTTKPTLAADEVQDYFASISVQRKQARDEAIEVLASVAESENALEEAKQAALTDMNRLALEIEQEANIETLIQSKGFEQCLAVISDDKCSVIVETGGLLPGEVAQISEIVYEQAGIIPDNLKIIERQNDA